MHPRELTGRLGTLTRATKYRATTPVRNDAFFQTCAGGQWPNGMGQRSGIRSQDAADDTALHDRRHGLKTGSSGTRPTRV